MKNRKVFLRLLLLTALILFVASTLSFAANVALITGSSYETIPPQSKSSEIQEEFLKIILN